ncbi:UNVERIFIED_CONTAM: hypothetical protein HDU68_003375, partial [Siphonaria sp. JEL0065]
MSDMFRLSPSPSPSPSPSATSASGSHSLHQHIQQQQQHNQHRTLSTDATQQLESTVSHEKSGKKKDVYKLIFDNHLHSPLASVTISNNAAASSSSLSHTPFSLSHEDHDHGSSGTNASRSSSVSIDSPKLEPTINNHSASNTNSLNRSRMHSITSTTDQASPQPRHSTSPNPSNSTTATEKHSAPVPLNEVEEDSKRYLDFAKQLAERTKDPLDSQDIWKLCTRAKHAIDGGERLENLSWRLFEMSLSKERKAKRDGDSAIKLESMDLDSNPFMLKTRTRVASQAPVPIKTSNGATQTTPKKLLFPVSPVPLFASNTSVQKSTINTSSKMQVDRSSTPNAATFSLNPLSPKEEVSPSPAQSYTTSEDTCMSPRFMNEELPHFEANSFNHFNVQGTGFFGGSGSLFQQNQGVFFPALSSFGQPQQQQQQQPQAFNQYVTQNNNGVFPMFGGPGNSGFGDMSGASSEASS